MSVNCSINQYYYYTVYANLSVVVYEVRLSQKNLLHDVILVHFLKNSRNFSRIHE